RPVPPRAVRVADRSRRTGGGSGGRVTRAWQLRRDSPAAPAARSRCVRSGWGRSLLLRLAYPGQVGGASSTIQLDQYTPRGIGVEEMPDRGERPSYWGSWAAPPRWDRAP